MSIGGWEPLWLGPATRRLYAAFHAGDGHDAGGHDVDGASSTGVVLVPPLLHEQPRSRRFITQVASELAAMGLPCLRFDFHGTGDSAGSGEDVDFVSMRHDLDLAAYALRERSGIRRLVVLAWRGSALVLRAWMQGSGQADLVVLWDPVTDGDAWLKELVAGDAGERMQRPPPWPGIPRLTDPSDGQLMGFPVSPQLRADLAQARVAGAGLDGTVQWAVIRSDAEALPFAAARLLRLPANAPGFTAAASMDATFFLTPPVREVVARLGQALRNEARA